MVAKTALAALSVSAFGAMAALAIAINAKADADPFVPIDPPSPTSFAPTATVVPFAGGDWPGMGSFGEDWA
jgi:hypothetical protein